MQKPTPRAGCFPVSELEEQEGSELEQLRSRNRELERLVAQQTKAATRLIASFQHRALQLEVIPQRNEELSRLQKELADATRAAKRFAVEQSHVAQMTGELLARFSHEIRTPLNGIIGFVDLLEREEGDQLSARGRSDLDRVKRNARALLAFINDVLELSRIDAGHADLHEELIETGKLATWCVEAASGLASAVRFEVGVEPGAAVLMTDGLRLRHALKNLLSYAARATDTGVVHVRVGADGRDLEIVVEHAGEGIPHDEVAYFFDRHGPPGTPQTRTAGSRTGLAVARTLIHLLGGDASVESSVGSTKIVVTLPRVVRGERPVEPVRVASESPPAGERFHILVVDDDPMTAQLTQRELESEGFEVRSASDGLAALRAVRERTPNAILLDIRLPRLDGWDVLAELKRQEELRHIPVIVMSVEVQRSRAFTLGAFEYLVKPVEAGALKDVVSKAMGTRATGYVLITDDDEETRELIRRRLTADGYEVRAASNGRDALSMVRQQVPSLMILDLTMPGLDGLAVLERIRRAGYQFPVVVFTGKDLGELEREQLRQSFARVQRKGSGLDAVVGEVRERIRELEGRGPRLPRVLYVDDLPQNRAIVRRHLRGLVELLEAADGEEGVEVARREQPDLILMDLSLPKLDGWSAAAQIMGVPELANVPIVALTGHTDPQTENRARAAGFVELLPKPIERESLLRTVQEHVPTASVDA